MRLRLVLHAQVPHNSVVEGIVVCISPDEFGSSNLSACRIRSLDTDSTYSLPKDGLGRVLKLVNDILQVNLTLASN